MSGRKQRPVPGERRFPENIDHHFGPEPSRLLWCKRSYNQVFRSNKQSKIYFFRVKVFDLRVAVAIAVIVLTQRRTSIQSEPRSH